MSRQTNKRIYADTASATPMMPEVARMMAKVAMHDFANGSSLHREGMSAGGYLQKARKDIAVVLDAHSDEIVFTGGGTEGNNLAIQGVVTCYLSQVTSSKIPHIVTSAIEHSSVLETCRALEKSGRAAVTYVPVTSGGIVTAQAVAKALRPETVLVSIMYANNEIGTIQPIAEIAKSIRHYKKLQSPARPAGGSKALKLKSYPVFHTDACQAAAYLPLRVEKLGVDLLTLNGSKLYGPKGIGALYVKRQTPIAPIIYGGNQEGKLRPGTENVASVVGLAYALLYAEKIKIKESKRLQILQDYCFTQLLKKIPDIRINGDRTLRLPNNVNISIPGIGSERLVIELDAKGIAASGKSACKSDEPHESYVISALGETTSGETGSLRLSFGRETTKNDITIIVSTLAEIVRKIRTWR